MSLWGKGTVPSPVPWVSMSDKHFPKKVELPRVEVEEVEAVLTIFKERASLLALMHLSRPRSDPEASPRQTAPLLEVCSLSRSFSRSLSLLELPTHAEDIVGCSELQTPCFSSSPCLLSASFPLSES